MIEYKELYNDVKMKLSEKRFRHSEGVVERAVEYAEIYDVNIEKTKLVAIAHDIAKELDKEKIIDYASSIGIELDEIEKNNLGLAHAKIGAKICKDKYNFDEDMVNAVKFHTTGRENMSILEKIIYLADATEKGRKYNELDWLVNLTKQNIDEALVFTLKWTIDERLNQNKDMHIDTVKAYNFYN